MSLAKVALVTGGNSGIGYETVKALMQSDRVYRLLLAARTSEKAEKAVASLRQECPQSESTVEPLELDLISDESIEKAYDQIKANHGVLDTLINNAGTSSLRRRLLEES